MLSLFEGFFALLLAPELSTLVFPSVGTVETSTIRFCHLVALRNNTTALGNNAVKHGQVAGDNKAQWSSEKKTSSEQKSHSCFACCRC